MIAAKSKICFAKIVPKLALWETREGKITGGGRRKMKVKKERTKEEASNGGRLGGERL